MGKRSREKRERRERGEIRPKREKPEIRLLVICKGIIWAGVILALFTPLIISGKYFFPFVGPKSLYFMGLVEIIFFVWLILMINSPQYRPRQNPLLIALILFLVVLTLSSLFGENLSNSFWSKPERMTGLLMWFHLLAFFVVISSVFKSSEDWFKIFRVSIFAAVLISLISLLAKAGINVMGLLASGRGGATIGNSSFMGTYLLFNIFLALYLFSRSVRGLKIYSGIGFIIITLALLLSSARAAILSFFGGLALLSFLYLIFIPKSNSLKLLGKTLLVSSFLILLICAFFIFQPDNIIHQKFIEKATKSRLVVWEVAWKGFLERPWLGWGPENFDFVFTKYFNPCMFLPECGGEIWFDRAHNIIFDNLVATGIIGFLSYLGIFGSAFYVLWKKFFQKYINFWTVSIPSVILISYSVQNLTVFDMVNSYLMFLLVLGFVGSFTFQEDSSPPSLGQPQKAIIFKELLPAIILIIFCFSFFKFIFQPLRTDAGVIETIRSQDSSQRLLLFKKTLETSPLGKYQIREFFADSVINFSLTEAAQKTPKENIIKEFEFVSKELEKTTQESPLDFRAYLKLGRVYNVWSRFDLTKTSLAEETLKKAIELSPRNQQGYWELAQTRLYQKKGEEALLLSEKAMELEPRVGQSHLIIVQIAQIIGDKELAKKKAEEAIKIIPSLEPELKKILGN